MTHTIYVLSKHALFERLRTYL